MAQNAQPHGSARGGPASRATRARPLLSPSSDTCRDDRRRAMAKGPRRRTLTVPRSPWETTLDETGTAEGTQAGEIEPGREDGGGGDKGIDADTGDGGHGGGAGRAGHDEGNAPPRPPPKGDQPGG